MARGGGRKEYSMEVVQQAEDLYCVDGLTYDEVARQVGVATSTLKRWAAKWDWAAKREELRAALSGIKRNTVLLRAKLIENCLNTLGAMDAFAVAKLEEMALKAADMAERTREDVLKPHVTPLRTITTDDDAVAALEEAVAMKLNGMLANPGQVDFRAVQDVKKALDLVRDLRAAAAPQGRGKSKGLSPETADQIRREILGIA